jgi:asparagine synthase (glutamine-hydrolysing)
MCGICGILSFNDNGVDKREIINEMTALMVHRGPDDDGYYFNDEIGLGIRRLAIIDIEGGHQPILSEDGRYVVILNGEIYNYIELRQMLIRKGHVFKTDSDTEVIVHLFEEKGSECASSLNGMFAFTIWDNLGKELFLFRDRIGIKPLYYTIDDHSFTFASHLLSICKVRPNNDISFESFLNYLGISYVPYPETIFKDICKLEPGHFLKVKINGQITNTKYWDIKEFGTLDLPSIEDYRDNIMGLLKDSISMQKRSDVAVGTFLSGGIDSSCIVALLSEQLEGPVRTFSAGFEGGLNELPYAKMVAEKFGTDHTELMIKDSDLSYVLPEIIDMMDEPLSDNSIVPTYMLSKLAVKYGVKVVLNGTGGDELFGGYERYIPQKKIKKAVSLLPDRFRKGIGRLVSIVDLDKGLKLENYALLFAASTSGANYTFLSKLFRDKTNYERMLGNIIEKHKRFVPGCKEEAYKSHLMYFDLKNYLVGDVLSLLDKMTMAVSLEGRVPMLDHRVVELCYSVPDSVKFRNGKLKGLLKSTLQGVLPDEIMHLPKSGFAGPIRYWIEKHLIKSMFEHLIEDPLPFYREYLNIDIIKETLLHKEQYRRFLPTLFSLYIFNLWYRKHIMGEGIVI